MMTSSNGNIFRVTGPLCGEFTGPGEFPTQRPVTRSFDVFFDLRLNKRLSKQPWGWWFETPSWSLRRQCNVEAWRCVCVSVTCVNTDFGSMPNQFLNQWWSIFNLISWTNFTDIYINLLTLSGKELHLKCRMQKCPSFWSDTIVLSIYSSRPIDTYMRQ